MSMPNAVLNIRFRLIYFLCVQALLFLSSGCATWSVWQNSPAWEYESIATATGKALSGESPTVLKNGSNPEIRVSYSDANRIRNSEQIPPRPAGCIVLKNTDDSLRLLAGLDSFLHSQPSASISSIKAVISHEHRLHNELSVYKYKIRLGLTLRDAPFNRSTPQQINSSWTPLLRGRPAQGDIKHYSPENAHFDRLYAQLDSFIIDSNDNTLSYFLVGGPSGGGPSGSTNLTFVDDCGKPDYVTLLNNDNHPFAIQFVDAREIKKYKYPLPARILLTPFSVALDIVTSPVQLLLLATAEYWMPR